jgi:hypothetical protein
MPWGLKRYYGTGSLHFITWSCYQRKPLLGDPACRILVLTVLELMGGWPTSFLIGSATTEGAPSLRSLQGWATTLRALFDLVVGHKYPQPTAKSL